MINLSNWNYSHYSTGPFKAMISVIYDYNSEVGFDGESCENYCLTVLKDDFEETFQAMFSNIEEAVQLANQNYGHWNFQDTTALSGCDACSNNSK